MKVLTRYISIEFVKVLVLCLLLFISIFLVIDFLQKIDNFIDADVPRGTIFAYFFFQMPYIFIQMIPVATLISVIVIFSNMKNNNEIIAMKTCGLNILNFSTTMILLALIISVTTFFFSELVVSHASSKSNEIWDIEVEKQDPNRFYGSDQIWYRSKSAIYWIKHYDSVHKIMQNPTFYFFDKDFHLIKRIEGKRGVWVNGVWRIEDVIVQKALKNGGYEVRKFITLFLEIPETPDTFVRKIKHPEEMSFSQLKSYAERVKNEGYDNTRYLVDLNIKLAFPFLSLILVFMGIPIALELKTGGIPLAIALGIGLCFLYMVILSLSRSLGLSGVLPPVLAAWTANLVFLFLGIYLILNMKR